MWPFTTFFSSFPNVKSLLLSCQITRWFYQATIHSTRFQIVIPWWKPSKKRPAWMKPIWNPLRLVKSWFPNQRDPFWAPDRSPSPWDAMEIIASAFVMWLVIGGEKGFNGNMFIGTPIFQVRLVWDPDSPCWLNPTCTTKRTISWWIREFKQWRKTANPPTFFYIPNFNHQTQRFFFAVSSNLIVLEWDTVYVHFDGEPHVQNADCIFGNPFILTNPFVWHHHI